LLAVNVRKLNLCLWTAAGICSATAILCAAWGLLAPIEVDEPAAPKSAARPATSQASPDTQLSLATFEPIWALDLRRPLTGPAMAAGTSDTTQTTDANPGPPTAAGGPFTLVGTIGDSVAMIRTPAGQIEVKSVGELASGARIVAIRPMQVDVELNGQRMTIAKPREPGGG
jgi:hypothetical protein